MSEYKDWLKRARSAFDLSRIDKGKNIVYEDLCFQAQQAAEKALKALYIYYQFEPPRTHNLVVLLNGIREKAHIPEQLSEIVELNDYAVQTRYPGDYTPIERGEYERAVELAERALQWVEGIIDE
ncbi:MAG TPA: HEPN domain-containing protein [Clostridia bacterium]|nr:HEPN domain-containing protein [Clostridia bacterium]